MNRTALKEATARAFAQWKARQGRKAAVSPSSTNKWRSAMKRTALGAACLAAASILAGCATPTPNFDRTFGDAVRAARLVQTANPQAGADTTPVVGQDGVAARESIVRYHDSFKTPPPVSNVINIGGVVGGQ